MYPVRVPGTALESHYQYVVPSYLILEYTYCLGGGVSSSPLHKSSATGECSSEQFVKVIVSVQIWTR